MSAAKKTATPAAPGVPYYTPEQNPPAGTPVESGAEVPTVFTPLTLRSLTLSNRFAVAPMCMYSADDGHLNDFHLVHLGAFALHGAALTIVEATSVTPNGRISPEDSGLWKDSQIAPLKRITDYVHSQGQKAGIQLAHGGRKASTLAPWHRRTRGQGDSAGPEHGGWPDNIWGPSAIPYSAGYPTPKEMTADDIQGLVQSFVDAAKRSIRAGFDTIEIHGAHGYLISEFLSPLTNRRTDKYGGSFENRTRLLVEIVKAIREVIPETMPLLVRVSATEWMEWSGQESWTVDETVRLAKLLPALGVDLLDVSSGGNNSEQRLETHPYFQIDIAGRIREALRAEGLSMAVGAVGMITNAEMARSIVQDDGSLTGGATSGTVEVEQERGQKTQADLILIARQFLREPEFVFRTAQKLGVQVIWPHQYHRAEWPRDAEI